MVSLRRSPRGGGARGASLVCTVAVIGTGLQRYMAPQRARVAFACPVVPRTARRQPLAAHFWNNPGVTSSFCTNPGAASTSTLATMTCAAALAVYASTIRQRCNGGTRGKSTAIASQRRATRGASSTASQARPRVAFVIGGPGSGKGTQCERIANEFGLQHLSAGDLLRAERERPGSTLGAAIEETIKAGRTVPSEMIADILENAMREAGWSDTGFVVDGYPRSAEQLQGWETVLSKRVDFLFCLSIDVGREEMLKRLLGRALTSGRLDDNPATIEKRFVTFEAETGPLLEHFDSKGLLRRVNGGRGVEEVWGDVRQLFLETEMGAHASV